MTGFSRRLLLIALGFVFFIVIGFIFDNTMAIPILAWLKGIFGLNEIRTYITNFSITTLSIVMGLFIGFYTDKWKAYRDLMNDLEKILPLIEFEIRVNYLTLKNPPSIVKITDFMFDYWELYKNEAAKWAPINITVVIEIYGLLKKWTKNYDMKAIIMQNCVQAIETWVDWYNGKLKEKPPKSALDMRKEVIEKLNKLDLSEYKKIAIKDMIELKKYPINPLP